MTDPTRVHVLAFGLERYDYGPEMDLPGSASDAVRFAEWAIAADVPPRQVWVGLSRLDETQIHSAYPHGIRPVGTTKEAIRRTFVQELADKRGDLLLVYWSGHGVVNGDRERALFTSDMTESARLNIRVEMLLNLLASMSSFSHQMVFVDACATHMLDAGIDGTLYSETWDIPRRQTHARQEVIFGAAQGQAAYTNRTLQSSVFSSALLRTLTLKFDEASSLPPNANMLFSDLNDAMELANLRSAREQMPLLALREYNGDILDRRVSCTPRPMVSVPEYIGSHKFVGRESETARLDNWLLRRESSPLLVVDAIGGSGKSFLCWSWTKERATGARPDIAGRFWYSFYERGATMLEFSRRALAYVTTQHLDTLSTLRANEVVDLLVSELNSAPWLFVLDGLERVLVAYDRIDASSQPDDGVEALDGARPNEYPNATIIDQDGDFLRRLAGVQASKVLCTTRLIPSVLLNPSGQPIPGVERLQLGGLAPIDAEMLLRSCGVVGTSEDIRRYLLENCDNHPLVIGALAGLIVNYRKARGNFDAWASDTAAGGGGALHLGRLRLTQRRNHIVQSSIDALAKESQEILYTLAHISEATGFDTIAALNPFMPKPPKPRRQAGVPEDRWYWRLSTTRRKVALRAQYRRLQDEHRVALSRWRESSPVKSAETSLAKAVTDLEQRGLLQYDHGAASYDLHPVVRDVALRRASESDRQRFAQPVIEYYSSSSQSIYAQARKLSDLAPMLNVYRILVSLDRHNDAAKLYADQCSLPLRRNLEAYPLVLRLLNPILGTDWCAPNKVKWLLATELSGDAAEALRAVGRTEQAFSVHSRIIRGLLTGEPRRLPSSLLSLVETLRTAGFYSSSLAMGEVTLAIARASRPVMEEDRLALMDIEWQTQLSTLDTLSLLGRWNEVDELLSIVGSLHETIVVPPHRRGDYELAVAKSNYRRSTLSEAHLSTALHSARDGINRPAERLTHRLRGLWYLEHEKWADALASFREALSLAHESGISDSSSQVGIALGKLRLRQMDARAARMDAERFSSQPRPDHLLLGRLWLELGDREAALNEASVAFFEASADGEGFVNVRASKRAREIVKAAGAIGPRPVAALQRARPVFDWEERLRDLMIELEGYKGFSVYG